MRTMARILIILGLAVLSLSGCATPRLGEGNPSLNVVSTEGLPQPSREDTFNVSRPSVIGAYDKLDIEVYGVEDLKREVQADGSGRLSFPLAGVIEAAGLTTTEVAQEIANRLRGRYIRDPQVTVNIREAVSQMVALEGEVKKPGLYPIGGKMTLVRAIATAGGLSDNAKLSDVVVFREVNGKRYAGLYNMQAIRRGMYADPEIYSNDVITVGDSKARQLFQDFLGLLPLLTTPLILIAQQ